MKLIATLAVLTALTGCATPDYKLQLEAEVKAATARKDAAIAIAESSDGALHKIVNGTGDAEVKKMAMLAWALTRNNSERSVERASAISPPSQSSHPLYALTNTLLNVGVQYAGLRFNYKSNVETSRNATNLGMKQSDNATALGINTNSVFSSIAGMIQAPAANVTNDSHNTTNANQTYSLAGTGAFNVGSGVATLTDRHDTVTTTDRHDAVTNSTPVVITPIVSPTPVVITPVVSPTPVVITPVVVAP